MTLSMVIPSNREQVAGALHLIPIVIYLYTVACNANSMKFNTSTVILVSK